MLVWLKIFVQVQTFQWRPFMPLHNFCYPIDEFHWASQTDVQLQSHSHVRFLITSKCICKSDARCLQPAGGYCCLLSDVWDATSSHQTITNLHRITPFKLIKPVQTDWHNSGWLKLLQQFQQTFKSPKNCLIWNMTFPTYNSRKLHIPQFPIPHFYPLSRHQVVTCTIFDEVSTVSIYYSQW